MPLPPFVIPRFNPREIPGLQAWYDAADAASVITEGSPLRVSQWSDKSGLGRHATNTTSGSTQPSYTTAGRNGLNVLTFAAASVQRLTVPSSTATFKFLHDGTESYIAAVSVYGTVANPNAFYGLFGNSRGSLPTGFQLVYRDSGTANDALTFDIANNGTAVANGLTAGNSAVIAAHNNLAPAQTMVVQEVAIDADNATASQRIKLRVNGGTEVAENNKTGAPDSGNAEQNMQIGAVGNNVGPLQGDICEILLFNQLPTAAARDLIRRYLGSKWGVTVG